MNPFWNVLGLESLGSLWSGPHLPATAQKPPKMCDGVMRPSVITGEGPSMGVGRQMEGLNTLSEAPVFFFFF